MTPRPEQLDEAVRQCNPPIWRCGRPFCIKCYGPPPNWFPRAEFRRISEEG